MRVLAFCVVILAASLLSSSAWAGTPPLGPKDAQRRLLAPYDMIKLNCLGMNYCENLLDARVNIVSYTHLNSDSNCADAWHLHFPDDVARLMEGVAWESEFSPVVRLELARRMTKGLIAAHYPGTQAYNAFRHRSGGKTDQILTDQGSGRVVLSDLGDSISPMVKVGFRAEHAGEWQEIDAFQYSDEPKDAGSPGVSRNPENWNKSPYVFERRFTLEGMSVDFTGKCWLSDEDMPLEFGFSSADADRLQIVVGEPGKSMPLLRDGDAPSAIHLPDRKTTYRSDGAGDKTFNNPAFNYFLLTKKTAWAAPGYSTCLMVMWKGRPDKIEALAENGYGQIRFSYSRKNGMAAGKVWLLPIQAVNEYDREYLFRNAEHFLGEGKLMMAGFPPQQMHNAIPAGLAAGAYMLTKYNDPLAPTARINATNAVNELFDAEKRGMKLVRVFFPVRAAAWMVKTGKVVGDKKMVADYTAVLDLVMKRMLSPESGYDGKAWPGGWDHWNSVKAMWLAYDATGKEEYREAWERALTVYTIDDKGIYRYGKPMDDPGGMNTYFGSMPMGVWGNAGMMENIPKLINLDVISLPGWKSKAWEMWHDAGCGPWAQDDANPEYVGLCLKGANIPRSTQYLVPVGAFPMYDAAGKVEITRQSPVENPFFLPGDDKVQVLEDGDKPPHNVRTLALVPGSAEEKDHLVTPSGTVDKGVRRCKGKDSLVYRFSTKGSAGAGIDLRLEGRFLIEVSPDGKRWYERLDSWSDSVADQSLDLSFLTGSEEELLKMLAVSPPDDAGILAKNNGSEIVDGNCRCVATGKSFVYRLKLPDVTECRVELLAGNCYKVEASSDGKTWRRVVTMPEKGNPDAAWLQFIDLSAYLGKSNTAYLKFTGQDNAGYGGRNAFLRRTAVYGILDSDSVYVRISGTSDGGFALNGLTFRQWAK